jgi:hypothetical protein
MSLEKIIRPFQTREITPPRIVATPMAAQSNAAPAVFTIGKGPGVKILQGSETIDVTYYMKKWMKEKKTET